MVLIVRQPGVVFIEERNDPDHLPQGDISFPFQTNQTHKTQKMNNQI